jgi:hypothetical protein
MEPAIVFFCNSVCNGEKKKDGGPFLYSNKIYLVADLSRGKFNVQKLLLDQAWIQGQGEAHLA